MMKRVTATVFLLAFTASMLGRSVERANAWASQHGHKAKHSTSGHSAAIGEAQKQSTRQGQTNLQEDGSILLTGFCRSSETPPSTTAPYHALTGFATDSDQRTVSPRAPPAILS